MKTKTLLIIALTIISLVLISCAGGRASNKPSQPNVVPVPEWYGNPQIGDELFFYGRGRSIDQGLAEETARHAARAELLEFLSGWASTWGKNTQGWRGDEDNLELARRTQRYDEFVADSSIRSMQYTNRVTWEWPTGGYEAFFQVSLRQSQFLSIINNAAMSIDNGVDRYLDSIEESGQEAIREYRQRMERLYKPTTN